MRRLFNTCICIGFVLSNPAAAAESRRVSVADFQETTFTKKEGAPESTWAMAQTSDGWLWFGGSAGLTRFDGLAFEKLDVGTTDGRLSSGVAMLYALPSGGLVIGHLSGGVTILGQGPTKRFDDDDMRAAGRPLDFVADQQGFIWATFEKGVMRFDGTNWTRIGPDWKLPSGRPGEIYVDGAGTLWMHALGHIARLERGQRSFELIAQVEEPGAFVQSQDGTFYFLGDVDGISRIRKWTGREREPAEASRKANGSYFDRNGNYWTNLPQFNVPESAVADLDRFGTISMVLQDAENNVWVAETGQLNRLRPSKVVRMVEAGKTAQGKVRQTWINVIADSRQAIWFTTVVAPAANSALRSVGKAARAVTVDEMPLADQVAADPDGSVWAGDQTGLWERQGERFTKRSDVTRNQYEFPPGLVAGCAGGVWAADPSAGVRRFHDGAWQDAASLSLPTATPTSLYCDRDRNLWLGYGDGRIARVDELLKTTFFPFVGPSIGAISSMSVGRQTLVGGSRGLAVLDHEGFVRVTSLQPILEGITGIVQSPDGYVWLNGARGLIRVWSSDLEGAGTRNEIRTELLDTSDGFPGPAYSLAAWTSSIAMDADQRVWFAGLGGLAFLETAAVKPDPGTPRTVFKSLRTNGRAYEAADDLSLPPGTRSVEIAYTALRAQHPDRLRFRYRLDDVDDGWVNVEERRQAIYTNLPPGAHRFHLDVSDEFGSWTNNPTTLAFEIPPTFVQSRAFQALCIAALFGLVFLAYRLRVRQLESRHRRILAERLDERERIARELHDTLLQGTQALLLKVHAATSLAREDEPIHQVLDKALDQATSVMVEARNRIEDLRMQSGLDDDLAAQLTQFAEELLRDGAVTFEASVEGSPRGLVRNVSREAGLIGREALLNAFHHAKASTIELQIEFTDDLLLRVRDDGIGFDETALIRPVSGRHWGLPGMQERARTIGSMINVWSRQGGGTEIELRVPGSTAYAETRPRSRWEDGLRKVFGYAS